MATPKAPARKVTYDEFVNFPDDGLRHELIDGEHYVTPSPATKHQRVLRDLLLSLGNYLVARPGTGEVFAAPFDVVFSNVDIVEPDLLVVLDDQSGIITEKHVRGAPAIVVEILSPGTNRVDWGVKRSLYDRAGVREYWVVNPDTNIVTVHTRPTLGDLAPTSEVARDRAQSLTSALLPGWSLALDTLFK